MHPLCRRPRRTSIASRPCWSASLPYRSKPHPESSTAVLACCNPFDCNHSCSTFLLPINHALYAVAVTGRRVRVHIASRDDNVMVACPHLFSNVRAVRAHVTDESLLLTSPQQLVFAPLKSLFGGQPRFRQMTISGGVKATQFVAPRFIAVVRSNRVDFIDAEGASPLWDCHLHDHV